MNGDNFRVCFVKISHNIIVWSYTCGNFCSTKTPYKTYGDKFFPENVLFVAPRNTTFLHKFNFHKGAMMWVDVFPIVLI